MSGVLLPTYNGAAVGTAITQRNVSNALLVIDSEDRYKDYDEESNSVFPAPNSSPYDFTISKNQSILNGFLTRLGIAEVCFPFVLPNINTNSNTIVCQVSILGAGNTVITQLTLPFGFYTPAQLASAIQAQVRLIPSPFGGFLAPNFTMTYGILTTTAVTQMPLFEYCGDPADAQVWVSFYRNPDISPTKKQLYDLLGFDVVTNSYEINNGNPVNPALAPIFVRGGQTYCQYTRYIDITCQQLLVNRGLPDTMTQDVSRDVLCRLYIADPSTPSNVAPSSADFCPPGTRPMTIYRDFATPKSINWVPNIPVPGQLRFQVFADDGSPLAEADPLYAKPLEVLGGSTDYRTTANNKCNWSMTIMCTEN